MNQLTITASKKNYEVHFLAEIDALKANLVAIKNAIVIFDRMIYEYYPQLIDDLKAIMPCCLIDATEDTKTFSGLETVLQFLQQHNTTKSTTLIAIGGGITQDLASFAAHIYYRGLRFVFVPTTLLSMCDSCIGGKVAINFHGYKNQLGAFHSPEQVLIWTGFTQSLAQEAMYSGYGEILKLMLIESKDLYDGVKLILSRDGCRNHQVSNHIYQSLLIKKRFIEADEFDEGVRRILNYGHTFGHALELATNYALPHGIAVARGIDIANYISYQLGFLSAEIYQEIHAFIATFFYCDLRFEINTDLLISYANRDKKITNNQLNMVLLNHKNELKVHPIALDHDLKMLLQNYLDQNTSLYSQ